MVCTDSEARRQVINGGHMRKQALLDTTHMDMGDTRTYSTELYAESHRQRSAIGPAPVSCHAHARVPAAAFNNERPALRSVSRLVSPTRRHRWPTVTERATAMMRKDRRHGVHTVPRPRATGYAAATHGRLWFGCLCLPCLRAAVRGSMPRMILRSTRNTRSGTARPRSASTRRGSRGG